MLLTASSVAARAFAEMACLLFRAVDAVVAPVSAYSHGVRPGQDFTHDS